MLTLKITYSEYEIVFLSIFDDVPLIDLAKHYKAESVEILDYEL